MLPDADNAKSAHATHSQACPRSRAMPAKLAKQVSWATRTSPHRRDRGPSGIPTAKPEKHPSPPRNNLDTTRFCMARHPAHVSQHLCHLLWVMKGGEGSGQQSLNKIAHHSMKSKVLLQASAPSVETWSCFARSCRSSYARMEETSTLLWGSHWPPTAYSRTTRSSLATRR